MSHLNRLQLALVLLATFSQTNAASLFDDDTILDVSLSGPLGSMFEANDDTREYPFKLDVKGVSHAIDVRLRGKSRRRVCTFPPIRLNFRKDDASVSDFTGQNKLKLVTHCRNNAASQTDTLEEYAAYKIFNVLSDVGYKVRLLRISYTDTDGRQDPDKIERYGFVLEAASTLAERIGGQQVDTTGIVLSSLNAQQAATVYIFQYLIANTDWSLVMATADDVCCHNGDIFDVGSDRFIVPYDFDLAGLVNARYAEPDPSLRISNVRQRRYRGYCIESDALKKALSAIKSHREDIFNVIRELPGLTTKNIDSKIRYLDRFFKRAEDEEKLLRSFERRCL